LRHRNRPELPRATVAHTADSIAVIDLGTNTFHLLIIEVQDRESYTVKEKFKVPVKLGEGGINQGRITPAAYKRGMEAFAKFARIIESRGVSQVFAYATSAIRSAANGPDFVADVLRDTGIQIRTINGNEEAALIYRGVRAGVPLPTDQDVLIVDIGGGSVEFIVADHTMPKLLRSLNIGAARLLDAVRPSDPIKPAEIKVAEKLLKKELGPLIRELKEFGIRRIVGSSGSFETLGALVASERSDRFSRANLNSYVFGVDTFHRLHKKLLSATNDERRTLPGMEPERVEMIHLGTLLIKELVESLGIQEFMVSTFALKEGILFKYLEEYRGKRRTPDARVEREDAVRTLARRFGCSEAHANHVSMLALTLFDQLQPLHGYGADERELLHYAALLYECGRYIQPSGYHKHGQYIINNSSLRGFSSSELLMLSNLVRYHRKSLPSPEHLHFNVLPPEAKERVRRLAGLLRVALNLDRAHRASVLAAQVHLTDDSVLLQVHGAEALDLEIEAAMGARELFEQAFSRRLSIKGR
jgi:exopolyphosphatase/guanosine-5'-triphosphate,3'-diphosphate pyrophosphatase